MSFQNKKRVFFAWEYFCIIKNVNFFVETSPSHNETLFYQPSPWRSLTLRFPRGSSDAVFTPTQTQLELWNSPHSSSSRVPRSGPRTEVPRNPSGASGSCADTQGWEISLPSPAWAGVLPSFITIL